MKEPSDFTTDRRVVLLTAMALVIGAIAALVARALLWLIALFTNVAWYGRLSTVAAAPRRIGVAGVLIPIAGGIVIGLMARFGSDKIRGHGIPEALEAILIGRSRIQAKVAVLKPVSSAISIGTGGPFGAEGPIIMTGGAIGSLFAQHFHLSSAERKTLLVAGAAAGMSATFGTPVAAVLLAVELLLFEWKPRSFIPVVAASALAAAIRPFLLGAGALFPARHPALPPLGLLAAAAVGVAAGLASAVLTLLVYGLEDLFSMMRRVHWMWWPAIGGLAIGLGGLVEPRALGVGYENIRGMLDGRLVASGLVSLLVVKALIWSFSLGSGTSGGVLAPLLIMGGALGALESHVLPVGGAGMGAMLGMAAMIGGTMRSPLTAIVFTLELTHDVLALPALLIACTAAFAVTVLLMKRSILTEKVARRGHHLTREYAVDPFALARVRDVMTTPVRTMSESTALSVAAVRLASAGGSYVVVDGHDRPTGVVTRADAVDWPPDGEACLRNVVPMGVSIASQDETVGHLADRMAAGDEPRALVVDGDGRLVGIVSRGDLLRVRLHAHDHETQRQRHASIRLPRPR